MKETNSKQVSEAESAPLTRQAYQKPQLETLDSYRLVTAQLISLPINP